MIRLVDPDQTENPGEETCPACNTMHRSCSLAQKKGHTEPPTATMLVLLRQDNPSSLLGRSNGQVPHLTQPEKCELYRRYMSNPGEYRRIVWLGYVGPIY